MQIVIKGDLESNREGSFAGLGGVPSEPNGVSFGARMLRSLKASAPGRSLERAVEELNEGLLQVLSGATPFVPRMKVRDERLAFVISALLTGVNEDTVQIAFEGKALKITGARTEQRETRRRKLLRVVTTSRTFERLIPIDGTTFDRTRAVATLRGDILRVYLPKTPASHAAASTMEPVVAVESAAE
jgi:HSP20 family molecular chaperone IbpA